MIEDGSVPGILLWPLPAHAKRDNVVWALAHFHDARGKADFATYSNPTGDLAKMWPPRKPEGL